MAAVCIWRHVHTLVPGTFNNTKFWIRPLTHVRWTDIIYLFRWIKVNSSYFKRLAELGGPNLLRVPYWKTLVDAAVSGTDPARQLFLFKGKKEYYRLNIRINSGTFSWHRSSSDTNLSGQPTNRMDLKTKWLVIGLLSFALGSIFLASYFLTPGYNSGNGLRAINHGLYSFSEKHYAWPFAVSLMAFGFFVLLLTSCNSCE